MGGGIDTTLSTPRLRTSLPGPGWIKLLTIAALLTTVYHRAAAALWNVWTHNDNYSHGALVPCVALGLVWWRRDRLAAMPGRTDARGLPLIALACALQVLGIRSDVMTLQGWSMPIMAFGLALTFLGPDKTRVLAFPIAYLGFMLPFPSAFVNTLSYALKEITVAISTQAAEVLGVLLQRRGMTLFLTDGELRVENPCSGLRSLIALLATGAVFAWIQPGGGWRRAVVLLSAVPIAVLGNAVRLTTILLVAHYAGVAKATGRFHDWSGYLVYAVALAGLFGVRWLLTPRRRVQAPPPLEAAG